MTGNDYHEIERWLNAALEVFRRSGSELGPHDIEIRNEIRRVLEKAVAQNLWLGAKGRRTGRRSRFLPGLN